MQAPTKYIAAYTTSFTLSLITKFRKYSTSKTFFFLSYSDCIQSWEAPYQVCTLHLNQGTAYVFWRGFFIARCRIIERRCAFTSLLSFTQRQGSAVRNSFGNFYLFRIKIICDIVNPFSLERFIKRAWEDLLRVFDAWPWTDVLYLISDASGPSPSTLEENPLASFCSKIICYAARWRSLRVSSSLYYTHCIS